MNNDFYEIESEKNNWSVRELQRQFDSSLYERLALSKDKKAVKELSRKGQIIEKPTDAHTVLEFLDLREDQRYTESNLENAVIDKLEHFMTELGKGFLFAGRQKRFTFDGDVFYVDLVFYNRLLKCFVLLDLKIGRLTHQDIGQMQNSVCLLVFAYPRQLLYQVPAHSVESLISFYGLAFCLQIQ